MKNNHHSRKTRQLARIVEELKIKMSLPGQAPGMIHRIKLRIKFLLQELSGFVPKHQLTKILGAFAFVFGFSSAAESQAFLAPVENPFGIVPSFTYLNFPEMADLDNDGDIDMLVAEYYGSFTYYENTGTAIAPAFATGVGSPFGLIGSGQLDIPALADLDGDGDLDVLSGTYYGLMIFYENTGAANAPAFGTGVSLPFGLTATYSIAIPTFVDLDSDGDMDLIVTEGYGNFMYFENTGLPTAPSFGAPDMNPFGLTAAYDISFPEFGDIDDDGDMDLIIGQYYGNFQYYENTGTITNPAFAAPVQNPFGLTQVYEFAIPAICDLDGDGDLDIMSGEYYGAFQFFENEDLSSLDEIAINGSISPNPFSDQLTFDFEQTVVRAEFVNLAGQIVLVVENPMGNVDVNSLEQGSYIVKCTHSNKQQSQHKLQKL